jgi:hypothetical protein
MIGLLNSNFRLILCMILCQWFFIPIIICQTTESVTEKQNKVFIGITLGPSTTSIKNKGLSTISGLVASRKNSFIIKAEIGYTFSKYLGLSTGIGFNQYTSTLSLNNFNYSYDTIDSDLHSYNRIITGENINEIQKISLLSLPVIVNFQIPLSGSLGFFVQSGLNLSIPVIRVYHSTGTFTYSGFYKSYNVIFTDIPYEGFESNIDNNVYGKLAVKSFIPEFTSSAGFQYLIHKKNQISIGIFYNKLLSRISNYSYTESFNISSQNGNMKSVMGGSNDIKANSYGLAISFRHFLF